MRKRISAALSSALRVALLASAIAGAATVSAAEVADVKVDDQLSSSGTALQLNGAGLRSEYFFSVYVAALYVPQKTADADAIIGAKAPHRMLMVMKRDVGAGKMLNAFHRGLAANVTEIEQQALKPRLDELDQAMTAMQEVKEGDRLTLDFGADGSVALALNGESKATIAGPGIASALLKIWLGEHPVQDDLKKALLGK